MDKQDTEWLAFFATTAYECGYQQGRKDALKKRKKRTTQQNPFLDSPIGDVFSEPIEEIPEVSSHE